MIGSSNLSLGPMEIPFILIIAIAVYTGSYALGAIPLSRDRVSRKSFNDIFSSALLPFLIAWKFSLILTDTSDVIAAPGMLLYSTGSATNFFIAVLSAAGWLTFRWIRNKPGGKVNSALIRSAVLLVLSIAVIFISDIFSGKRYEDRTVLPSAPLEHPDGEAWTVEEVRGNPVVLNFWASWCPPCKAEMPMLAQVSRDTRFSDVTFFAVNAAGSEKYPDAGGEWLEKNGLTIPLLYDREGIAGQIYQINSLPTTIVLDSRGRIVEIKTGAISRSWLKEAVRRARRTEK